MRKNLKTLLTTTAVLAALAGGPALYVYADTPSSQGSGRMMQGSGGMMQGSGGMMQGGQGNMMGMMNMMGQMSQMTETCNNVMKGMAQDHGPGTPKESSNPEKKG